MKRKDVIVPVAITSGLSAGLSIVVAVTARVYCPTLAQAVEYPIVAARTLLPPLWFCFEWVFPCRYITNARERERIKHLHEPERNIWVALVAVLDITLGIGAKYPNLKHVVSHAKLEPIRRSDPGKFFP